MTSSSFSTKSSRNHLEAFAGDRNFLSWGHLLFSDVSAVAVGKTRQILLVRDPYDWVIARGRFFVSEEFQGLELLKEGTLTVEAILNMMIVGSPDQVIPLAQTFHLQCCRLARDRRLCRPLRGPSGRGERPGRQLRRPLLHRPVRGLRNRSAARLARTRADWLRPQAERDRARKSDRRRGRVSRRSWPKFRSAWSTWWRPDCAQSSATNRAAYAAPVSLASRRGSIPSALNEAAQRSSVGVSNRMRASPRAANQPCRVISSSSWPSPHPA